MPQFPSSVLLQENQLSLNKEEASRLPAFREFLRRHPNPLGQVLLGLVKKPWKARDARRLEDLVARFVEDEKQVSAFLAIAHNAAHYWSISNGKPVSLPRFLALESATESPSSESFAAEAARYRRWRAQVGVWVKELLPPGTKHVSNRDHLLAAIIVSSMLHGGAYGGRVLAGILRAIARHRERSFVVGDRVHVDLVLSWGMLAEGETRVWVPDPLSACLWAWVQPGDVAGLLKPVVRRESVRQPSDNEIIRRAGDLLRSCCARESRSHLGSISDLRRCCWVMAHVHLNPVLARYADGEISANSPPRKFLRRLFPKGKFVEFRVAVSPACELRPAEPEVSGDLVEDRQIAFGAAAAFPVCASDSLLHARTEWVAAVCKAAAAKDPRFALAEIVRRGGPEALLAEFGISVISSTHYTGNRVRHENLASVLKTLGDSLGAEMEVRDLVEINSKTALEIYLRAVERRPVSRRRQLINWILEFDLFIRARLKARDPIPRSKLPWPPEDGALDPGFVTHDEYEEILSRIDESWNAFDSPRRKRMMRLIVVIAFRLGLRGGEIRQLRLWQLLIRGEPEILLWPFKGDKFKTRNARRRVPLRPLLSKEELDQLIAWRQARSDEKARESDRLFAIPEERLREVPRWLLEDMNEFLRLHSTVDADGGFVHMHTFRHACQSWMFMAMMMREAGIEKSPFACLPLTNEWFARGNDRLKALYGHDSPTAKHAFLQASLAGHGEFFTTARSYLHFFPWVLASFLDASPAMKPSEALVRSASGQASSTARTWYNERGIHDIAVQLLLRRYRTERVIVPESDPTALGPRPEISALEATRSVLCAHAVAGPTTKPDIPTRDLLDRAEQVAFARLPDGTYRHRMEFGRGGERLAIPARPMRQPQVLASEVWDRIAAAPSDLVCDGLRIFIKRVENHGWVRFAPETDVDEARRYIRFLCEIGFTRNTTAMSGEIQAWQTRIGYQGAYLNWRSAHSSKQELSIWPDFSGKLRGTQAGLCYALVMAYIRFGRREGEQVSSSRGSAEVPRCCGPEQSRLVVGV